MCWRVRGGTVLGWGVGGGGGNETNYASSCSQAMVRKLRPKTQDVSLRSTEDTAHKSQALFPGAAHTLRYTPSITESYYASHAWQSYCRLVLLRLGHYRSDYVIFCYCRLVILRLGHYRSDYVNFCYCRLVLLRLDYYRRDYVSFCQASCSAAG